MKKLLRFIEFIPLAHKLVDLVRKRPVRESRARKEFERLRAEAARKREQS